jgi:hypothetical protein
MERGQTLAREPATSTIWPLVADLSAGGRTEGVTVARALPPTPTSRPTAVRGSLSEGPVASSCRRASTAGRRTLKHGQTFGPTVACDGVIGHAKRGPGPSVVFGSNVPASLQVPTSPTAPSLNAPGPGGRRDEEPSSGPNGFSIASEDAVIFGVHPFGEEGGGGAARKRVAQDAEKGIDHRPLPARLDGVRPLSY